jgi:hypothetical protein
MTIKDLKKQIELLPDDMKVGGIGHFGEYLECFDASVDYVFKSLFTDERELIYCLSIESAGEEPD